MTKTTTEEVARQTTAELQPAIDFRVTGGSDPRQAAPTTTPMPAPLERALGINQPRKYPLSGR